MFKRSSSLALAVGWVLSLGTWVSAQTGRRDRLR